MKDRMPEYAAEAEESTARSYAGVDVIALLGRVAGKIHWILLAGLIGALITWFYVSKMVMPVYQATSKIYIAGSDTTISL